MARPLLALGGIVLIGVGAAIGFGWWMPSTAEADTQLTSPVRSVRLETDSGSVRLRVSDGAAKIHQSFSYHGGDKPGDGYRMEGDQLVLGSCGDHCSIGYDIVLPSGVPVTGKSDSGEIELSAVTSVDVTADSGRVRVSDVPGAVTVTADSGEVDLKNIGQNVRAKVGSGSIRGDGLRGSVDAQTDSGSIKLALDAVNSVKAKTDSGGIDLTVPSGSYRVQGSSDSGRRDIQVAQDSSAAQTLDLGTDSGSVRVRTA
ncbi:DUF4097 family beta strand repeat-containing protein [Amycolatopsis sp. H20-H5]|uniref:DUF4097 family beta strand repeat-containing protein n=1 Tax=Amycolatopsis sp. H20-H5 TaxID=3046309 RepID=UPI002DB8F5AF|nr:DUF4097 family beta strand repeat-containing protein [Amycolatopsis sp. H20-H5]MEC3975614.1 DUF4097 family beta strand repeat-containing protein [Amycolatopsis sp. H20-H5]